MILTFLIILIITLFQMKHLLYVQRLFGQNYINQRIKESLTKPLGEALVCMCSVLSLDKLFPEAFGCILDVSAYLLQHTTPAHILEVM